MKMLLGSRARVTVTLAVATSIAFPTIAAALVSEADAPAGGVFELPLPSTPWAATPALDETYQLAFEPGNTAAIVKALNEVRTECASLPSEYRIDCLAQGLKWAGTRMNEPDYALANSILRKTGGKLEAIVNRNLDPSKPALEANTSDNPAWKKPRRYRAVKRDSLAAANTAARQAIDEGVKELLRAAEGSADRRSHYTKIAAALESTKTLLRSS